MKNKRPFVPGFLNKLDRYLLLNNPGAWSSRTHLVVYYGILFGLVLTLVCFFVPDDPRKETTIYIWMCLVLVISVIGFIVWLIFLVRFNVFKRFSIAGKDSGLKIFMLYFMSGAVLVSVVFIPPVIQAVKANLQYKDREMAKDINDINLAVSLLNIDSIPAKWNPDTMRIRNQSEIAINGDPVLPGHTNHFHLRYGGDALNTKKFADSLVTINDSLFVVFKGPQYAFLNVFDYSGGMPVYRPGMGIFTTAEIYSRIFKNRDITDRKQLSAQLKLLLDKYGPNRREKMNDYPYDSRDWDGYTSSNSYYWHLRGKYGLEDIQDCINNISGRKYMFEWSEGLPLALRFFYYTTLILTLLIFIFRHSATKTFFLSMLTGIILLIFTLLCFQILKTGTAAKYAVAFVWALFFITAAITINYDKKQNISKGIALNLAVFFTVMLPVLVVAFYYQLKRGDNFDKEYEDENMYYFYAEITGVLLLLVLIEILFKKLYRKWYALPEA